MWGLTPVRVSIVFPTRPMSDLRFQIAKKACRILSTQQYSRQRKSYPICSLLKSIIPSKATQGGEFQNQGTCTSCTYSNGLLLWRYDVQDSHNSHVSMVSPFITPRRRFIFPRVRVETPGKIVMFTLAYGNPVGVEKAGSNRLPKSYASDNSSPLYHGRWNACPVRLANMCADKRPPRTRIVLSNTCGLVSTSKDTQSMTCRTALSKPGRSSSTTKESSTSMRVRE
jgi:hypothetical protein